MKKLRTYPTITESFWPRVQKTETCWVWTGDTAQQGYGRLRGDYAHRVAWRLYTGQDIPKGMFVCHHCDNRPCVRPDHLFLGTQWDNMQDAAQKGRMGRRWRLNPDQVREVRALLASGALNQRQIAEQFDVAQATISEIKRNEHNYLKRAEFL